MPEQRDSQRAARLRARDGNPTDGDAPDIEVAALRYDGGNDHAPKMVAHGRGHAAQKILEIAEEHDVAITKDPTLVSILGALDIGAEIPPDLYGVIAEVLAWAYKTDKQAGEQRTAIARRAA